MVSLLILFVHEDIPMDMSRQWARGSLVADYPPSAFAVSASLRVKARNVQGEAVSEGRVLSCPMFR